MKLAFIGVAYFALSASPTSFAKDRSPMRPYKKAMENAASEWKSMTRPRSNCTNFSGTWKGTCTSSDSPTVVEETSMEIKQEGCTTINIDGIDLNINGTTMLISSPGIDSDEMSSSATQAYRWNDAQTRLRSILTGSAMNGLFAVLVNSSMWLEGGQLRRKDEDGKILSIDPGQILSTSLQDCSYAKVETISTK